MKNKPDFAYHTVYRYLVGLINDAPGDTAKRLPSLRQLALRLKVSVSTVQNACHYWKKKGGSTRRPNPGISRSPM